MTLEEYNRRFGFGIDRMRHIVGAFSTVNESFNQRFSIAQLGILHRAWLTCEWDIAPDRWAAWQVAEALRGITPRFDDNGKPVRQ